MFKLNPAPEFEAPVQLTVPGNPEPEVVRFTFKHKTAEGLANWYAANEKASARDGLAEVIVGWSGVVDDDGVEVTYSKELLTRLLHGYPAAAAEIVRGYVLALTESRAKN